MKRRKGFTLVELLVVIGIIALLISILLPALNKARQQANKAACLSNLHSIGVSMAGYVGTYKGTLPEGVDYYRGVTWWSLLAQQMGNQYQAINNLGAIHANGVVSNGSAQQLVNLAAAASDKRLGAFRCKDAQDGASLNNYTCHPLLMPDMGLNYPAGFPEVALANTQRRPYRITHISNPTQIILVFDGAQCMTADLSPASNPPTSAGDAAAAGFNLDQNRIANTSATNPGVTYMVAGYNNIDLGQPIDPGPNTDANTDPGAGTPWKWGNIRYRHSNNTVANVLFADGHAGSFNYKKGTTNTTDLLRRNICVPVP